MNPKNIIQDIEQHVSLPLGTEDRFAGYSVVGLPFRSGHVLALRRFPASSVGPAYTSVWHRNPAGRWTFYSTVPAHQGCSRYYSKAVDDEVVAPIQIDWPGPARFRVEVKGAITWEVMLSERSLRG